jgi:hypothetical protein
MVKEFGAIFIFDLLRMWLCIIVCQEEKNKSFLQALAMALHTFRQILVKPAKLGE